MGPLSELRHWALTAAAPHFWITVFILFVLTITALVFTFVFLYRTRIMEDTPTSRIRSAAQGFVELSGKCALMDGMPIISPLTTTQCCWYRYKVEKLGDKHTKTIASGVSDDLFLLVEPTGQCVIDPDGATIIPGTKQVWYESEYPSQKTRVFSSNMFDRIGARYRYTEERMHPGDPLYALGMFVSIGGAEESFNTREEVSLLLKAWKNNRSSLLEKFDSNKDGEIDMQEWEAVRKAAYQTVKNQQRERGLKPLTHLMARPIHTKRPFILSFRSQHALIKNFRLKAGICLAGFLGLGSVSVWMVTLRSSL